MAPLYDFKCEPCNVAEEVYFGFADKQELTCEDCGKPMEKMLFPVGVIFRGGGWGGQ